MYGHGSGRGGPSPLGRGISFGRGIVPSVALRDEQLRMLRDGQIGSGASRSGSGGERRPAEDQLGSPPKVNRVSDATGDAKTVKLISGVGRGSRNIALSSIALSSIGYSDPSGSMPNYIPVAQQPVQKESSFKDMFAEMKKNSRPEELAKVEEEMGIGLDFLQDYFTLGKNPKLEVGKTYSQMQKPMSPPKPVETEAKKPKGKEYAAKFTEKERRKNIMLGNLKQVEEADFEMAQDRPASNFSLDPNSFPIRTSTPTGDPPRLGSMRDNFASDRSCYSDDNLDGVTTVSYEIPRIPADEETHQIIQTYFRENEERIDPKSDRGKLPISSYRKRITSNVQAHRITIIEGPTGCGKTTQVPQYLMDEAVKDNVHFNIIVTQPRRIAAISVAKRVAAERNIDLGTLVGYQVGMDRRNVSKDTRLLYCTTGVLLQRLILEKKIEQYSHIIIDEVHERSEDTDLLLMVVRKLLFNSPCPTKIVLMSATFNVDKFSEYFEIQVQQMRENGLTTYARVSPAHITTCEEPQRRDIFYLDKKLDNNKPETLYRTLVVDGSLPKFQADCPGIFPEMYQFAEKLICHFDSLDGTIGYVRDAVLVFLPGMEEIQEMQSTLARSQKAQQCNLWVLPLHSTITAEEQEKVFRRASAGQRKVILATNIAESSITVPDIVYVIDFCLQKSLICDPDTHFPSLQLEWASKASCDQRAGRSGRVTSGRVYRLVPEGFFSKFQPFGVPEILRSPLELSVLRVKRLDMGEPKALLGITLDPPNLSEIQKAVLQLKQVGALSIESRGSYDPEDGDLTAVGMIMSVLPIDVRLGKLIIMGHVFDCLEDCIIIASCLSNKGMFSRPYRDVLSAYKSRLAWSDRSFSDCFTYLNAYKMYKAIEEAGYFSASTNDAKEWCKKNFIQLKRIRDVDSMYMELRQRLSAINIRIPHRPNERRDLVKDELILKVAICGAFYPNYFLQMPIDAEEVAKTLTSRDPCTSVVIGGLPQNRGILYAHRLREIFTPCSQAIDFDFEETRALLTFIDDKTNPLDEALELQDYIINGADDQQRKNKAGTVTAIKMAVYVALKMARTREISMDIRHFSEKYSNEKMIVYNKRKEEELARKRKMFTNRIVVPAVMGTINIPPTKLPSMADDLIPIYVTHIVDAGHFWAQYYNEETRELEENLKEAIELAIRYPVKMSRVKPGDIVLAPLEEYGNTVNMPRQYARGRVESTGEDNHRIVVFFLDYGNIQVYTAAQELLAFDCITDPTLIRIPALALEFKLSEIKPSAMISFDGSWPQNATHYFAQLVSINTTLRTKIYSIQGDVIRCELIDESGGYLNTGSLNINDELMRKNFAERWEESLSSRYNHESRVRARRSAAQSDGLHSSTTDCSFAGDEQIKLQIDPPECDNSVFVNTTFRITGPRSPIETEFAGCTKMTYRRKGRVEPDSVNSVVLEPDYLSKNQRLLVSSCVQMTPEQNLILRDTTLMPNIRGFASLMALIFAPRCEFRIDKEAHQYIGALCGLGYRSNNKVAYDADSDMELFFDAAITREDITLVNMIRYYISDLLQSETVLRSTGHLTLVRKQGKIRNYILQLLKRPRRLADYPMTMDNLFQWGLVEDKMVAIDSSLLEDCDPSRNLLPLHNALKMDEWNWYDDIADSLEEINQIYESELSTTARKDCKLCKVKIYTLASLGQHLNSAEHLALVQNFKRQRKLEEDYKADYRIKRQDDEEIEDTYYSDEDGDAADPPRGRNERRIDAPSSSIYDDVMEDESLYREAMGEGPMQIDT